MRFEDTPYWQTLKPIIASGAMQAAMDRIYRYPYRINLYPGTSCMFRCNFCNRNYEYVVKNSDNVFSQLISQDDGSDKHRFGVTGGLEPLTSPYIGKICKDLHDGGYISRLVTNGFLLNNKMLSKNPYINSLDNIRVSLYGLDEEETTLTAKHPKGYRVVKKNLQEYNRRSDRTRLYLNYVLLPNNINKLKNLISYIIDIGGADNVSLREDHSFRYNVEDRNKLQDELLSFDEALKGTTGTTIDYGYGLKNAMLGLDTPLVRVSDRELIDTQSPQVKVCVDPNGDVFSYMDAGFVGRPGAKRHCLGNVTNSSLEKELSRMKKIKPQQGDTTYLDAFNHLVHKYIYEKTK
jgi:dTDP-4-amino-4,6-dideoxy-D-glucose ammonia-lyase